MTTHSSDPSHFVQTRLLIADFVQRSSKHRPIECGGRQRQMLGESANRNDRAISSPADQPLQERTTVVNGEDNGAGVGQGPCVQPFGTGDVNEDISPTRIDGEAEFGEFFVNGKGPTRKQAERSNPPQSFVKLRSGSDHIADLRRSLFPAMVPHGVPHPVHDLRGAQAGAADKDTVIYAVLRRSSSIARVIDAHGQHAAFAERTAQTIKQRTKHNQKSLGLCSGTRFFVVPPRPY